MSAQDIFGKEINDFEFSQKYNLLSDQERYLIERVATRLFLVSALQKNIAVFQQPFSDYTEQFYLRDTEIPALSIYLLFTCIDTLAGKKRGTDFPEWLKKQPNVDLDNLNYRIVNDLYFKFTKDGGVGSNLRSLFIQLPDATREWIISNVEFQNATVPYNKASEEDTIKLLQQYFYIIRRNSHTHSSISHQVYRRNRRIPAEQGQWWVTPAEETRISLTGGKKEWKFRYRLGIDENLILRIIIHSIVLKKMNISISAEIIQGIIKNYEKEDTVYAFVNEVNSNINYLNTWSAFDLRDKSPDYYWIYVSEGLQNLSVNEAGKLSSLFDENKPLEQGLKCFVGYYMGLVKVINSEIEQFNLARQPLLDNEGRAVNLKSFFDTQQKFSTYIEIINLSKRNEMQNLWLILQY